MVGNSKKTSAKADAPITASDVERWFRNALKGNKPLPDASVCERLARQLEKLRIRHLTPSKQSEAFKKFAVEEERLAKNLRKYAALFCSALEKKIGSLEQMHEAGMRQAAEMPEYYSNSFDDAEDVQVLNSVKDAIEMAAPVWNPPRRRKQKSWHFQAALIARHFIASWRTCGKTTFSFQRHGPLVRLIKLGLERVYGSHQTEGTIARAFERNPKLENYAAYLPQF
jgi:hypothetical protein